MRTPRLREMCVASFVFGGVQITLVTYLVSIPLVHVDEGAPVRVGARVGVGHRAILHGCTVEDDCLIGMGSVLLNGAHIGAGSVVAAGAVVPEGTRVPPGSLVVGVPARVTRAVDDALRERIRQTWEHYVMQAERHRAGTYPAARPSL